MKKILRIAFLICLTALVITPGLAQADVAPPAPPLGSSIEPGEELTNVRMLSEVVTIDVAAKSESDTGSAGVTADFTMRNLGDQEEHMDVRFPLYSGEFSDDPRTSYAYYFPPLENFTARVDGNPAAVYTTNSSLQDPAGTSNVTFPGWANFPVVFPPGKDVTIHVSYTQRGYGGFGHGSQNYVKYSYVLFTGAGWKGTIGKADIIVRLPMQADDSTVITTMPENAALGGNEIRWHFEDFEPASRLDRPLNEGDISTVEIGILQPSYWFNMLDKRAYVEAHPEDWEGWGRLGKALKEATAMEHGIQNQAWYEQSKEAYQKAVDHLPNDAEWHYGYADLVCLKVLWTTNFFTSMDDGSQADLATCRQQLDLALSLKPDYSAAADLKEWVNATLANVPVQNELTPTAILTPFLPVSTPTPTLLETGSVTPIPTSIASMTFAPLLNPSDQTPSPLPAGGSGRLRTSPTAEPAPAPTDSVSAALPWLVGLVIAAAATFILVRRLRRQP